MSTRTPVRFLVATTALALAVSACGAGPGSQQDAPDRTMATIDPALVQGLHPTTYTDDGRNIRAEVPVVASARQLTAALEVLRERSLREAFWNNASEVRIGSQVVASGPGTLGIMVTPSWQTPEGQTTKPALVWYDADTKSVYSSPVLIQADQWPALKAEVAKAARSVDEERLGRALDSDPSPQGDGPMLAFNAKGDLLAEFAPTVLTEERVTIRVPKDAAEPLLSDFGRRAATAATSPSGFDGTPGAGAAPTGAESTPRAGEPTAAPATPATPPGSTRPSTAVGPDCRVLTCVALTYDDGPGADTPKLVESLRQAKAPATFFQLGQMVRANAATGELVASAGNEIASHSMSHPDLSTISGERLTREIEGTADVLEETYGRRPMLMRPPYGSHNAKVDGVVRSSGAAIIQWDLDTSDWRTRSAAATESSVLKGGPKPNTIVLMHDIHASTVAAAPGMLKGLQDAGATLVTVSELSLNSGGYQAGRAYCSGTAAATQNGFGCAV